MEGCSVSGNMLLTRSSNHKSCRQHVASTLPVHLEVHRAALPQHSPNQQHLFAPQTMAPCVGSILTTESSLYSANNCFLSSSLATFTQQHKMHHFKSIHFEHCSHFHRVPSRFYHVFICFCVNRTY